MSGRKGFLMVTMEPPATLEEEFNDWYDTEHLPERARIAGFESARRFVCVSGWPRYLAFYDLEEPGVLDRAPYRAISGSHFSPWSKRILNRVRGLYRALGPQIYPGSAIILPSPALMLLRFHDVPPGDSSMVVEAVRDGFERRPETTQVRLFESDEQGTKDVIGLIGSRAPFRSDALDPGVLGRAAPHLDLFNGYLPYFSRGNLPGVFAPA